jgi:hypothetical protein
MMVLLLCIGGVVAAMLSASILILQQYRVSKGIFIVDEEYNGPSQVSATLRVIIRYALRRSVYFRKFFMQYLFHIMVRVMHYIDAGSSLLYAKSRNWFVENAVRNRGTVPHFWNHLKVYKKEMDQEKKEEEEEK